MQKARLHPATRCQAVSENSVWFFLIVPFLLLLLVPGTSCNGIRDPPSNVPQSLRNSQVCAGYRCGSSECVEYDQICDSVENCADGSDENAAACMNRTCEAVLDFDDSKQLNSVVKSLRCDNGECINDLYRCDGHADCGDASDETALACAGRSCKPAQFTCITGQCIPKRFACDGEEHCFDGTDEHRDTCRNFLRYRTICPPRKLNYCADRTQCYRKREHCDDVVDCRDGSDEDPEICGFSNSSIVFPPPDTPTRCDPPSCLCPVSGMEHVCLPCRELDNVTKTCIQLKRGARVCSVEQRHRDIKIDILNCGGQRLRQGCASTKMMVPEMTVVLADCWGAASVVLRCHSDGTWGEYGVEPTAAERMRHICQPRHINSQVCGRKPRYISTNETLNKEEFYALRNLHPWLVGLKRWERYECSATLITSTWLITAAHCVVRNQERNDETIDLRDLRVQLSSQKSDDQYVDKIRVHPHYVPGSRPHNDIALIRLESPLLLSGTRYPACVDLNGDRFLTLSYAMTFSRPNGENVHRYEKVLQEVDYACESPISRCPSLEINITQFCGSDVEKEKHLIGGSSGGPFMQNLGSDYTESWAVSGIVSTEVKDKGCELPFTIYTAVHNYKNWIEEVINSDSLF